MTARNCEIHWTPRNLRCGSDEGNVRTSCCLSVSFSIKREVIKKTLCQAMTVLSPVAERKYWKAQMTKYEKHITQPPLQNTSIKINELNAQQNFSIFFSKNVVLLSWAEIYMKGEDFFVCTRPSFLTKKIKIYIKWASETLIWWSGRLVHPTLTSLHACR